MRRKVTMGVRAPQNVIDSPWGWELQKLQEAIRTNETTSLQARWEYGRVLVQRRGDDKRLPNRALVLLTARDGISRSEINYRMLFAATYPTKRELSNALDSSGTWRDVLKALPKPPRASRTADPKVIGEATVALRRVLKDVRTLHPVDWGETEVRAFDELKNELMRIQDEINARTAQEVAS